MVYWFWVYAALLRRSLAKKINVIALYYVKITKRTKKILTVLFTWLSMVVMTSSTVLKGTVVWQTSHVQSAL